jgi:hypothetical protein
MSPIEQYPRNSVTVESPFGLRSFALRLGDVTEAFDPVLVVPTHANASFLPDGQVLDAVVGRFGPDFGQLEPIVLAGELMGIAGSFRIVWVAMPMARGHLPDL